MNSIHQHKWDILVPEEKEENLGKIEAYHCNLCPRRFRNNHDKKSYPGRGSIMCHLATEHGHLLKAMREDDKVDMTSEIEAIDSNDNGKWVALGLPEVPDEEMYTAKESFMWKYQQRKLNGETEKDKKPPPKPQECPHCNDCKGNTDPSRLRLHVIKIDGSIDGYYGETLGIFTFTLHITFTFSVFFVVFQRMTIIYFR